MKKDNYVVQRSQSAVNIKTFTVEHCMQSIIYMGLALGTSS